MIIAAYILSIIGIISIPIIFLLINHLKETKLMPILKNYRAYTSATKPIYAFVIILAIISIGASISAFIIASLKVSDESSLAISAISVVFALFYGLCLYDIYFNYEAIDNHYVYISRFGKIRKIKIEDINNFVPFQSGLIIQDKTGKKLFTMTLIGCNVKAFFEVLDEVKTKKYDKEEMNDNPINPETGLNKEESNILEKYGKKYKDKYIKNFSRIFLMKAALAILILLFISLAAYQLDSLGLALTLLMLSVPLLIILIVKDLKALKQVKTLNAYNLGLKGYKTFPEVKGHEKLMRHYANNIMSLSIITIVASLLFMIILPNEMKIDYNSLETKTGTITASEKYLDNLENYIGICLDDEAILYSASSREITYQGDDSFYDSLTNGQVITIHYKESDKEHRSSYYDEKIPCYTFYYININGTTYYDETDYEAYYNYYTNICLVYSIILLSISGILLFAPLIYLPISKKKEKEETVEIFKK